MSAFLDKLKNDGIVESRIESTRLKEERTIKDSSELMNINIDLIDENPDNEKIFNMDGIENLADNILKNGFDGAISIFKKPDGRYEISSGHRRFRAAKLCDFTTVPCIVKAIPDDHSRALKLLSSNINNRKMKPMDWARAMDYYENILRESDEKLKTDGEKKPKGRMDERIAAFFGISDAQVSRYKALLKLSPHLQELTDNECFPFSSLAKATTLSAELQEILYEKIKDDSHTRSEIEDIIAKLKHTQSDESRSQGNDGAEDSRNEGKESPSTLDKKFESFKTSLAKYCSKEQDRSKIDFYLEEIEKMIDEIRASLN